MSHNAVRFNQEILNIINAEAAFKDITDDLGIENIEDERFKKNTNKRDRD